VDSISFDSIAPVYDATRVFDEASFNAALDYIIKRFPPAKYPKLFEPGIGTGRIAIPLAERGYNVTGADISQEMLKVLAAKLKTKKPPLPVTVIQKDITALPYPDASFDLSVAVHIFHLIPEWKKAMSEVFRILKPGAPLILVFTGSGLEDRAIKDRYHELCAEYGYALKHPGMNSKTDLPDYAAALGRRLEEISGKWKWRQTIRVDKFLADIKARNYSTTKTAPDDVHFKAVEKLENEMKQKYGNLAIELENNSEIEMVIVLPG
jgi:ubiquinone/menaquinone biosynthesis C-methylase UbiE